MRVFFFTHFRSYRIVSYRIVSYRPVCLFIYLAVAGTATAAEAAAEVVEDDVL